MKVCLCLTLGSSGYALAEAAMNFIIKKLFNPIILLHALTMRQPIELFFQ